MWYRAFVGAVGRVTVGLWMAAFVAAGVYGLYLGLSILGFIPHEVAAYLSQFAG
jgi:hypothetical protein